MDAWYSSIFIIKGNAGQRDTKDLQVPSLTLVPFSNIIDISLNITGEDGEIEEGRVTMLWNKLDALHKMISMWELKAVWGEGRWGKCWLLMIQRSCQVRLRKMREMHHGTPWHRTQKET
jgi:hypothetical protein